MTITFNTLSATFAAGLLILAAAFGALATLITIEFKRTLRRKAPAENTKGRLQKPQTDEERNRRLTLLEHLMGLYSGVHSPDALAIFLNGELSRRHERWRVRVPQEGPGEIFDLDPT